MRSDTVHLHHDHVGPFNKPLGDIDRVILRKGRQKPGGAIVNDFSIDEESVASIGEEMEDRRLNAINEDKGAPEKGEDVPPLPMCIEPYKGRI